MKRTTINPENVPCLDFQLLIPKLCVKLKLKRNGEMVNILNNMPIDGHKFWFIYNQNSRHRIYVKCPKCKGPKLKLFKVEDEYRCRECHFLRPPRRKPNGNQIYTRYVRPLAILADIERQLMSDKLTLRKRQILEKKAMKLKKAIPEYAMGLRDALKKGSS